MRFAYVSVSSASAPWLCVLEAGSGGVEGAGSTAAAAQFRPHESLSAAETSAPSVPDKTPSKAVINNHGALLLVRRVPTPARGAATPLHAASLSSSFPSAEETHNPASSAARSSLLV